MQATLTELRRKTKHVVRAVESGKVLEITDHGKVIAEFRAKSKGMSGPDFARLWRQRKPMDAETAAAVLANMRAMDAAE